MTRKKTEAAEVVVMDETPVEVPEVVEAPKAPEVTETPEAPEVAGDSPADSLLERVERIERILFG